MIAAPPIRKKFIMKYTTKTKLALASLALFGAMQSAHATIGLDAWIS